MSRCAKCSRTRPTYLRDERREAFCEECFEVVLRPLSLVEPFGAGPEREARRSLLLRLIREKNPDQLQLAFALWTREAVRDLIERRFAVRLAIGTVGDYLRRWGFPPQKPVQRAYEQNATSALIVRWRGHPTAWIVLRLPALPPVGWLCQPAAATTIWPAVRSRSLQTPNDHAI